MPTSFTEAELFQKLRNADAAGDKVAAKRIADMIRAQRGTAPKTELAPATDERASSLTPRSTLEDIGVGLVTGVNKGVAAIPGIPGSIQSLLKQADVALGLPQSSIPQLPTAEDTIAAWERFSGKLPEPETRAGQYAESAGEFLPGGGGAGAVRKLATAGLLGGASEGGEEIGRAIGGEPGASTGRLAGVGAGLLAGKLPAAPLKRPTLLSEAQAIEGVPATAKEAKGLKDVAYGRLKADPARFDPARVNQSFVDGIAQLRKEGYTIRNTPALKTYINQYGARGPVRAMDIEVARQRANKLSSSKDVGKARVGVVMKQALDKYEGDVLLRTRPDLASAIMEGRVNTRAYKLGKDIEKISKKGEGARDVEASLRTRLRTYGANKEEVLPKELNQAIDEFLKKPLGRQAMRAAGGILRGPWNAAIGGATMGWPGLAYGLGTRALGGAIKAGQEAGALKRANLVKKIALMSPEQRADLTRNLLTSKDRQRRLLGESILLGTGSVAGER